MFDDVPENYRAQTATDPEEGWRYTQGDKSARRPPELLTRDHVARCIMREVREGRGSPHGGVFLDIAWIKERMPNAAEHIKKKLPSMYHQFKQLADIDITKEADGGRADDALRDGRHSRGWGHADDHRSGPLRRGRVRGRSSRREPARRQFSLGPAGVRQARRRRTPLRSHATHGAVSVDSAKPTMPPARARAVRRASGGEGPYQIQQALQEAMQEPGRHRATRGRHAPGAERDR